LSIFRFYEWQTAKPGKQPYFITFADDAPTKETIQLPTDGDDFDDDTKNSPFKGRLLTMAGYFDIWRPTSGVSVILRLKVKFYLCHCFVKDGEEVYTYTVITVEAKPPFSEIHHRMPVSFI